MLAEEKKMECGRYWCGALEWYITAVVEKYVNYFFFVVAGNSCRFSWAKHPWFGPSLRRKQEEMNLIAVGRFQNGTKPFQCFFQNSNSQIQYHYNLRKERVLAETIIAWKTNTTKKKILLCQPGLIVIAFPETIKTSRLYPIECFRIESSFIEHQDRASAFWNGLGQSLDV